MATQRYISTSFWDDDWIQGLDPSEKLLYLYLMTCPLTNIAGVYKITDRRISFDTGFNIETINNMIKKFELAKKAYRMNEYIVLPSWPKHQKWEKSSQIKKGIDSVLEELNNYELICLRSMGYKYSLDDFIKEEDTPTIPPCDTRSYSDLDLDTDIDIDIDYDLDTDAKSQNKKSKKSIDHLMEKWNKYGSQNLSNTSAKPNQLDSLMKLWNDSGLPNCGCAANITNGRVYLNSITGFGYDFIAETIVHLGNVKDTIDQQFIPSFDSFMSNNKIGKWHDYKPDNNKSKPDQYNMENVDIDLNIIEVNNGF